MDRSNETTLYYDGVDTTVIGQHIVVLAQEFGFEEKVLPTWDHNYGNVLRRAEDFLMKHFMSGQTKKIKCHDCQKEVSDDVHHSVEIRGWVTCPKCLKGELDLVNEKPRFKSIKTTGGEE